MQCLRGSLRLMRMCNVAIIFNFRFNIHYSQAIKTNISVKRVTLQFSRAAQLVKSVIPTDLYLKIVSHR